jgi:short-subunit dehydrogenase
LPGFVETPGFPQRAALSSRFLRRSVIEPEVVADRVVRALRGRKRELFVPRWYRGFAHLQALAPGEVGRLTARQSYRRRSRAAPG